MGSPAALDTGAYTAQYEALRAQMTAGDARGGASGASGACVRGIGLAVLIQDGLPAWLAAVEPMLSIRAAAAIGPALERTASAATPLAPAVAPDVLPPAKQGEVTLLLAALVLSTARVARRDPSPARAREGAFR